MTDQLYLVDAYQKECTAVVAEVGETNDHQSYLILDQTIMYPQGGGQPSDKGTISSKMAILNVKSVSYNGGEIKHIGVSSGTFQVGDTVKIEINWKDREHHMQLHTAGHVLDMAVRTVYPKAVPVQGVHGIGKKLYVEYEGELQIDNLDVQSKIDEIITSNLPIKTQFVTLEELKKLSSWIPAKLPASKKLRVLSIGDTYHIPDGGTQLTNTGECMPITVTQTVQHDGNTEIHYQVGKATNDKPPKEAPEITNGALPDSELSHQVRELESQFASDIQSITTGQDLESLRIKYLSKTNGLTTKLLQSLRDMSGEDKRVYGPILNGLKNKQEQQISDKHQQVQSTVRQEIDITIPGTPITTGRLHPTTVITREMNTFFQRLGFSIGEGPEIETAEFNFRRLGVPEGHPATDLQDSLFIKEPEILLRTQTSSIETRVLSTFKPPMRVVVPGKCYRNETTSLTNSAFFYQYQGFVVDEGITIANLKDTLTNFHKFLFGDDVILRFRYKYYPEVSPGMGVDFQCRFCHGDGCQVCKGRGWIEALGSGMIHVNTLQACGIDTEKYSGFAFGMGLDRMVMAKYGITDIRKLYGGELVYV